MKQGINRIFPKMKRNYIFLLIGILLIAVGFFSYNMDVDSKTHYFINGIWVGLGISFIVAQIPKLRKK